MRRKAWQAGLMGVVLMIGAAPQPAQAQLRVIDPANLAQSVMQAARALEQIHNQIQQIEQQTRMLATNPLQLSPELSQSFEEAQGLFEAAEGLSFQLEGLSEDLRVLYPETWAEFDLSSISERTRSWLGEDRASIELAMRAQARASQALSDRGDQMRRALQSSSSAEGQTGAVQASNQLLGVNATTLMEIEALMIAQGRALNTERLERNAREQRALEMQRRAFPARRAETLPARTAF